VKSPSLAVIERAATASASVENASDNSEKELIHPNLIRPNNVKLEAFTVKLAWGFASAVLLLMVVSILLVVAGYAGSIFISD
jgi:hypothetical protein